MPKHIKRTKYSFMSYFSGDFFVWIKSNDNFRFLNENGYSELLKKHDEFRYKQLIEKISPEELNDNLPQGIMDGGIFGDEIIDRFKGSIELDGDNEFSDSEVIIDSTDKVTAIRKWKEKLLSQIENKNFRILDFSDWENKINRDPDYVTSKTNEVIESGDNFIAFEPAFLYKTKNGNEYLTRIDVLIRNGGKLEMIELKASTNPKFLHSLDVYYQWKIINSFKSLNPLYDLPVENVYLGLVNRRYRKNNNEELLYRINSVKKIKKHIKYNPGFNPNLTIAEQKDELEELFPDVNIIDSIDGVEELKFENIFPFYESKIDFEYILDKIVEIQHEDLSEVIDPLLFKKDYRFHPKIDNLKPYWLVNEETNELKRTKNLRIIDKDMIEGLYIDIINQDFKKEKGDEEILTLFDVIGDSGLSMEVKLDLWIEGKRYNHELPHERMINYENIIKNDLKILPNKNFLPKGLNRPKKINFILYWVVVKKIPITNEIIKNIKSMKDLKEYFIYSDKVFEYFESLIKQESWNMDEELSEFSKSMRRLEQIIWDNSKSIIINSARIDKGFSSYLGVIYMYDFETFSQAVPDFDDQAPYEQIPFQYSIHSTDSFKKLDMNNEQTYREAEFLAKSLNDIGEKFWLNFVKDMFKFHKNNEKHVWVSWNKSFEKMVIKNEIKKDRLPIEVLNKLELIHDETIDMMDFIKDKSYYHYKFNGSKSIKVATKVFSPLNYSEQLNNVSNGILASLNAKRWVGNPKKYNDWWKNEIRYDMLKYCWYDTLSMLYILQGLRDKAKEPVSTKIPEYKVKK